MNKVSVIIPVYNIESHLEKCLSSITRQTLADLEIICVDDGSTDGSQKIMKRYANVDNRFSIITQKNAGPGVARNKGFDYASGEYVIFLDSDDWFEADFLERMVQRAKETNADVTICKSVEFDTYTEKELPSEWMMKTQYLPADTFSPLEIHDYIFQFTYGMAWDKLYRRNYIYDTKLRFPPLYNSEDLAFVFPSLLAAKRIAILDSVLIHHRINRSSSVSNTRSRQPQAPYEAFNIVKKYLDKYDKEKIYRRSFLNWAMEFLIWHVSNMDDKHIQRVYFYKMRSYWLPSVSFQKYPFSYFYSRTSYAKYLLAKYVPYLVFREVVFLYKFQKRLILSLRERKENTNGP